VYRFLLLYVRYGEGDTHQCYAEGLIHFDKSVYVRGFWKQEGSLGDFGNMHDHFGNMHDLRCWLRDNDDLLLWRIQMIDEIPKGEQP